MPLSPTFVTYYGFIESNAQSCDLTRHNLFAHSSLNLIVHFEGLSVFRLHASDWIMIYSRCDHDFEWRGHDLAVSSWDARACKFINPVALPFDGAETVLRARVRTPVYQDVTFWALLPSHPGVISLKWCLSQIESNTYRNLITVYPMSTTSSRLDVLSNGSRYSTL